MSKLHEFTATYETTRPDGHITGSIEVTARYAYSPGRPATPPAYDHGGLPPDPPEIDIQNIELEGGAIRCTPADFCFYADWLLDKHADAMIADAENTRQNEYEEAMERRAEMRREDDMRERRR